MGDTKTPNPFAGLAGGSTGGTSQAAGGAQQPQPFSFGGPTIPGAPGSNVWGSGSTFYAPPAGSSMSPEIINQQGNAYLYGPGGWQAAGTNASAPTIGGQPVAPYAGPNSTPGAAIQPYLSPDALTKLQTQLQGQLSGGLKPREIDSTLASFFGALPQTANVTPPPGGYVPGYQVPQASIQYVPSAAVANLATMLEPKTGNFTKESQLKTALSNWQSGLGNFGSPGVTVPTLGGSSTGSQK